MRKKVFALVLVLAFALGITAQAVGIEPMALQIRPTLTFDGTTATCQVSVRGESKDSIAVTAKLWQGNSCLKTWTASGTGKVTLSKTATVQKGKTYKLTADVTINGVKQPTKSVTGTCS